MGRHKNTATGVVVTVDDSKDERFGVGWEAVTDEPKKPARGRRASADDDK